MTIGLTAVSLGLQTDDPTLLYIGAIASLLPDIDTPISTAGRAFPGISHWLQGRFSHRSFTHSFVASFVLAIATYPTAVLENVPLSLIHAINIGYFAGWFADIFTSSGVEMFYPSRVRWALPSNRNLRLCTGSQAEYRLLVVLVAIALFSFHISANGGILIQFNRLIGSISGVEQLYNKLGATHLIAAQIKGVRALDYTPVTGDFWIIQAHGQGFIVQSSEGKIYKTGTEPDNQIIAQHITAEPGPAAISSVELLSLQEEELASRLERFNRAGALVFVSGKILVDDPQELKLFSDPLQFPYFRPTAANMVLETAPLVAVQQTFGEQYVTGELSVRSIFVQHSFEQPLSNLEIDLPRSSLAEPSK